MSLMRRTLNRVRAMPFRSVPLENIFLRSALVNQSSIKFNTSVGSDSSTGKADTRLKIYRKLDGIREMYRATGFGWFADFTEWPGIKPIADRSYDFFARNRFRLQGKTYEECVNGRCKIPGKK